MPTLAYFLTWTTYGTWLHGDERGSIDRLHNAPGSESLPPDRARQEKEEKSLKHKAIFLSLEQRQIVEEAIRTDCVFKNWHLLEVNCRSNHVHVVVQAADISPERVMTSFKANSTKALREAELALQDRLWTRHGSTRYINTEEAMAAAVRYVREQ